MVGVSPVHPGRSGAVFAAVVDVGHGPDVGHVWVTVVADVTVVTGMIEAGGHRRRKTTTEFSCVSRMLAFRLQRHDLWNVSARCC